MKTINSKYRFFVFVMIGVCLLCAILLNLSNKGYFIDKGDPMLKEDIDYLCEKLEAKETSICIENKIIYPEDFSQLISNRFETSLSTYQDVQNILAPFQMSVDMNQELKNFISYYDINRDGKFDIRIRFEGVIESNVLDTILFREDIGF